MARYFLRRLATMTAALWLVITITFAVMHSVPGGPFDSEKKVPPAVLQNLNARYHLDDPLWKQYLDYLSNLIRLDLGPSLKYDRTVNEIIRESFPVSASLGAVAVATALSGGLLLGLISALKHNRWQDYAAMSLAAMGYSFPSFMLGGVLMYIFSFKLMWLPPAMWGDWRHMVMPTLALAALPMAFIANLLRSGMIEALQQDYIITARAKGLSPAAIIVNHALRNAIMPVVTYLGPLTATVLTGSFVVESIFAIPGLGRYFVISILNRDYTLILGLTVFYAVILMAVNLIVDIIYMLLDPRIRIDGGRGE
ncbi:MAG: ABC transporter permease [Bacillota bacterium]